MKLFGFGELSYLLILFPLSPFLNTVRNLLTKELFIRAQMQMIPLTIVLYNSIAEFLLDSVIVTLCLQ